MDHRWNQITYKKEVDYSPEILYNIYKYVVFRIYAAYWVMRADRYLWKKSSWFG